MSLRLKTLLIVLATVSAIFILIALAANRLVSNGFERIESQEALNNVQRVREAFHARIENMVLKSADWAVWDDMYKYFEDKNEAFQKANLMDTNLNTLQINHMILVRKSGELIMARGLNLQTGEGYEAEPEVRKLFETGSSLMKFESPTQIKAGVALPGGKPLLVSIRPVFPSDGKGESRGWLVITHWWDTESIEKLAEVTHLKIESQAYSDRDIPAHLRSKVNGPQGLGVASVEENLQHGYLRLDSCEDKPALLLTISMPRPVYQEGQHTVTLMLGIILASGLVFSVVVMFSLERLVLKRVVKLGRKISALSSDSLHPGAGDELTRVATSFDNLIQQLQHDIKKREAAENASRQSANQMIEAQALSKLGSWHCNLANGKLTWSRQVFVLFGLEARNSEPSFKDFVKLVHPEDQNFFRTRIDQALKTGDSFQLEFRIKDRDEQCSWMLCVGRCKNDASGKVVEMDGVIQDITERKKAGEQIQKARLQLEQAIESLDSGFVMYDSEETLLICNQRYREMYPEVAHILKPGVTYEEILKEFCRQGAHKTSGTSEEAWIANRLRSHRSVQGVSEQRLKDHFVRLSFHRTVDNGLVSLRTDITDLVRAKQDAEAATRAKSEFLATMSHEIRTPMNGVIGMTGLLLGTELNREQKEYAQTVRNSAEALLTIINDILDFSKIEAGKLHIELLDFNLREAISETVELMWPRAKEKGIELLVRYPEMFDAHVTGDPGRIRQILLNLLGNAIKFTPRGIVAIEIEERPGTATTRKRYRFMVRDTGIGLKPDEQAKLFQPFSQADASTTRKFGGTGLGLVISKRLVELMGGTIGVNSTLGQGSTFWFELELPYSHKFVEQPQKAPSTTMLQRPAHLETPSHIEKPNLNLRILLAEDNVINQKVASKILEKMGCKVDVAANGKEAAEMEKMLPFDLIFMDCQMPEMDGFEATRTIRAAHPTGNRIPIIAMTANAMQGDRERCLEAGMDDYLTKPVKPHEILAMLEKYAHAKAR